MRKELGLPEARVLWRHALANAALPLLTVVGMFLSDILLAMVDPRVRLQAERKA